MAFQCLELGDSLYQNGSSELEVQLATGSGLQIIPGEGLALEDDQLSPTWQSWTPAIYSNNVLWTQGNGTSEGQYILQGKQLFIDFCLTWGSTTSVGAGTFEITLPATVLQPYAHYHTPRGICRILNSAIGEANGFVIHSASNPTTRMRTTYWQYNAVDVNLTAQTSTTPFTMGDGDVLLGSAWFQIA